MDLLQHALRVTSLAILIAGPACLLATWYFRTTRVPTIGKYVLASVALCTVAFWLVFLFADYILERQFHEIVPSGEWTPSDELTWTDSQRRVVEAYFGDGGRNVFALFAPLLLSLYSVALWAIARVVRLAT